MKYVQKLGFFGKKIINAKNFSTMKGSDFKEIKELLTKSIPTDFIDQVIKKQLEAGYKVDDWRMTTFGKLGYRQIIQSLIKPDSVISPQQWSYTPAGLLELIEGLEKGTFKFPLGTSPYFSIPGAFYSGLVHNNFCDKTNNEEHYHQKVQVAKGYCKNSGDELYPHRENLGVFNVPDVMFDVPIAVSTVMQNSRYHLVLNDGTTKTLELGKGNVTQIVVPEFMIPIIHKECTHLVNQSKKEPDLLKPLKQIDGNILWQSRKKKPPTVLIGTEKGEHLEHKEETLITDPNGQTKIKFTI